MKGLKNWGSSRIIRQYGDYMYLLCGTKTKVKRIQDGVQLDDLCECKMPCSIAFDRVGSYVAISDGKYGRIVVYKQGMPHEAVAVIKLPCKKEKYIGLEYDEVHSCFLAGVEDSLYRFTVSEATAKLIFKNNGSIFWGFSKSKAGIIAFLSGNVYERDAIVIQCYNEYYIRAIKCTNNEQFVSARHRIHYCDDGTVLFISSDQRNKVLKVYNMKFNDDTETIELMGEIQCDFVNITNCSISPNKSFFIIMGFEAWTDIRNCELKMNLYDLKNDFKLLFSEKQKKYETAHFYADSMSVYVSGSYSSVVPIESYVGNKW